MSDCYFCGEEHRVETHHIVPKRFDGSDEEENLVDVCPTCHSKLENLYDKRFYDELGVETLKGAGRPCDVCGSRPTEEIFNGLTCESYFFCRECYNKSGWSDL